MRPVCSEMNGKTFARAARDQTATRTRLSLKVKLGGALYWERIFSWLVPSSLLSRACKGSIESKIQCRIEDAPRVALMH